MTMHDFDGRSSRDNYRDVQDLSTPESQIAAIESQIAALGASIVSRRRHRDRMLEMASESVMRSNSKKQSAKVAVAKTTCAGEGR